MYIVLHRVEAFAKMRVVGATGPTHVQPLKEEKAIEVGAEILGEAFIYLVASSIIMFEYWRSTKREADQEAEQDKGINTLKNKVQNVEETLNRIQTRINVLEQCSKDSNKSVTKKG